MSIALTKVDALLRGQSSRGYSDLVLMIAVFGTLYGAVMGTFSATSAERMLQVFYGAVKVPFMLLVTFGISLPSFFVLNTLLGMRRDFLESLNALITTQAALTVILGSLAPFTALWYASCADYNAAVMFNGVMFAVASVSAQVLLRRLYRPLIARNVRHRLLLRLWLVVYIFVGIQMGWVLRPFIGSPYSETRFFREGAFSNAYVAVGQLVWEIVSRQFK